MKEQHLIDIRNRKERLGFIEFLEDNRYTLQEDKINIVNSIFPIVINLKNKTIANMGNITCSAGAKTQNILESEQEFFYNKLIWEIRELIENINDIENIKIYTIAEIKDNYDNVPNNNGVYFVVNLQNTPITFTNNIENLQTKYKGKKLLYNEADLIRKYNNGDKTILYIGKAKRKNGLEKRLKEYIEYGYGKTTSHRGGRVIWQIKNNKQLGICWLEVDNSEIVEKQLLKKYKQKYGVLPVANWRV